MDQSSVDTIAAGSGQQSDLAGIIAQALSCLDNLDDTYSTAREGLEDLRQRLSSGQFRLAVLGQFKRGKSTLLNALLGDSLLPTDILPVTAIPTFIEAAQTVSARVIFSDENKAPVTFSSSGEQTLADFLNAYVTEAGNPHNHLQVERVELGHPAQILRQGIILIDTPGIGSTHKHNTEVAYRILPQCDAALFLVSPDPPITEVELKYLEEIKQSLPRTFFLLNKIDFLDREEQVASLSFLAEQLRPLYDGTPEVLPVSARKGLQAKLSGNEESLKQSGMHRVERSLIEFFVSEKKEVLNESLRRRIGDQLHHVRMQLRLSLKAMILPEEELKEKIEQFRQSLPSIQREKQAAEDVLAGDHNRIVEILNREIEHSRKRARKAVISPLENHIQADIETEELERLCRETLKEAIPEFFAPEMRRVEMVVKQEATSLLNLHQQRSDALIEKVRQLAADLFSIPYRAPSAGQSYLTYEAPAWSSQLFISDLDPVGQKLSRKLLTRRFRHRKTVKRLRAEANRLVALNVEQISWALRRGVDESFRKYKASLTEQLDNTIAATRQAMEIALNKNESLASINAAREIKLTKAVGTLDEVIQTLEKKAG